MMNLAVVYLMEGMYLGMMRMLPMTRRYKQIRMISTTAQ
jgi:hypothetical protein